MWQRVQGYIPSISILTEEAHANNCYGAPPGIAMRYLSMDPESETVLLELPHPLYILGVGRITQLWFASQTLR